jgi:hypothetical protein
MSRTALTAALAALTVLPIGPRAQQEWSLETLRERSAGFQDEEILPRLQQIASLIRSAGDARNAITAAIQGDHREYRLKIERFLDQLADDRWLARESAERTLVEIGARAMGQIEARAKEGATLEERVRAARVLDAIALRGTDDERREVRLLRGLVATAAYLEPDEKLRLSLLSALGHADPQVVEGALLALARSGRAEDIPTLIGLLEGLPIQRLVAVAALADLAVPEALEAASALLRADGRLKTSEAAAALRSLWQRADAANVLAGLSDHPDPVIAGLATLTGTPGENPGEAPATRVVLADGTEIDARLSGGSASTLHLTESIDGLPVLQLRLTECEALVFPSHPPVADPERVRLFLTQGSLLTGTLAGIDAESVQLDTPTFGRVRVPRSAVQGLALDPALDRLVGATANNDRLRLRDNELLDAQIVGTAEGNLTYRLADGTEPEPMPLDRVAGILFERPRLSSNGDDETYARVETVRGERLLVHIGRLRAADIAIAVPEIGTAVLPLADVTRIEFGVGGGALWGFTLVADYSENRIVEIDDQGREVFALEDVYGAWDAECLDNGNLLVTEFALNRVVEVTRAGDVVWSFEQLRNPYDADRLPNGNTLIADTFGERVIEVDPSGAIVWSMTGVKPYDADRLPNGNTLIADGSLAERIIEVDRDGNIVWEVNEIPCPFDADRLPNGNTLIAQRDLHRVREIDPAGNVVFELTDLESPSDADRLPNGNTIVAEEGGVREFDRRGVLVFELPLPWAVEVNRY